MSAQIQLDEISVDVVLKRIKNLHLRVYPPLGRVRISAPTRMPLETVRRFAASKLEWIRQQQHKVRAQQREVPREYVSGESLLVGGQRYVLQVVERNAAPAMQLQHATAVLFVRPGTSAARRAAVVDGWYRSELQRVIPDLVARWEPVMGVKVAKVSVRSMRTRWGSCNRRTHAIRLNTELAKKSPDCLEYVVVHEMVHLLEAGHGERFKSLMTRFLPSWKQRRAVLNERMPAPEAEPS